MPLRPGDVDLFFRRPVGFANTPWGCYCDKSDMNNPHAVRPRYQWRHFKQRFLTIAVQSDICWLGRTLSVGAITMLLA